LISDCGLRIADLNSSEFRQSEIANPQ